MVRNRIHIYLFVAVLLSAAPAGIAATIIGGLEDELGSSGLEKNGDFNDVIFEITGDVTINAPGGLFSNLTDAVVNEHGSVFWDNPSGDGHDLNIGYLLMDDPSLQGLQYLAAPGGGSVNNVTFSATGPVTLTILGGITVNTGTALGWYALATPAGNQSFAVPAGSNGQTISFIPGGTFALYSSNGHSQVYSSVSGSNVAESANQQHFAFFEPQATTVPEPSTSALMGLGLTLLGFGALRRRRP